MPGERVTFEIGYEGRRMVARTMTWLQLEAEPERKAVCVRNVRPFGEDKHTQAVRAPGLSVTIST